MKKKLQTVAIMMVGSLLLTGCDIPKSLDDFVGWRSKFFLNVDEAALDNLMGPLLAFLMACAVAVALIGLISNLKNEKPMLSGSYLTGFGIILAITSIYVYIPVASSIGEKILPAGLTLQKVFDAMNWELSTNLAKIASAGWGITVTLVLPLISSIWQIVMLLAAIAAITGSIVGRTMRGVVFAYSQIFGWLLFLVMYDTFITFIGTNYPSWDSASVSVFMSLAYTLIVFMLLAGCYLGVPWMAFHLVPESQTETRRIEEHERERHGLGERGSRALDALFAAPVFIVNDDDSDDAKYGDQNEVVEGEIVDEEVMQQYYLPSYSRVSRNDSDDPDSVPPGPNDPINPDQPPGPTGIDSSGDYKTTGKSRKTSRNDQVGRPQVNKQGTDEENPTAKISEKAKYSEYELPEEMFKPQKKKSAYSKIAPKIETAAKLAEAAGVIAGKPEVVLAGKAVEAVNRVIEDVDNEQDDKGGVVKKHVKDGVARVVKDQLPEDLSAFFLPEEYTRRGK